MNEATGMTPDLKREMLRHTVATLAYRGAKAISNAPESFAGFRINETTRTPGQVLAHIGDLLDWALCVAKGQYTYKESTPLPWEQEVTRFFAALKEFDFYLASDLPLGYPVEKIFQGPIADALAHVGQLAMLRRMAGVPIRGESYFRAEIVTGRVGKEQSTKRYEFD
jgi:hypothetical protein